MKNKCFTEGKWSIFGDWGIVDEKGRLIASFEPLNEELSSGNSEESFANARLIKASPKMYNLLEDIFEYLKTTKGHEPFYGEINDLLEDIRGEF